jgi:ribosomal protein S18 acetylase RimI-like enzyme
MIEFIRMSKGKFNTYFKEASRKYAEEKEGINTKTHHLYSIYDKESNKKIGIIWFKINENSSSNQQMFLYDILINEKYRGKGFGTQTMKKLEEKAKELKCNKISLHVFAHNNPAISLYKKMGYKITNLMMSKEI